MRDVVKPGLVLFLITAVMALVLGVAQAFAAGPIARNAEAAKAKALVKVLPAANSESVKWDEYETGDEGGVVSYNVAANADGLVGWALTVVTKGYGGALKVMVGIDQDGYIQGAQILSHSETPGLGANSTKPEWIGQFAGKSGELSVTKGSPGDNEIQAIASSTITSKAVTGAVNAAHAFYRETLRGGAGK